MKLIIALLLIATSMTAQALTLEPVHEIPNTYNLVNWDNYTAEDLHDMNENNDANLAKREILATQEKLCNEVEGKANQTCKQAIELETTSHSINEPVIYYLASSYQAPAGKGRDAVMAYAGQLAVKRMTEDAYVNLLEQVCSQMTCN